MPVNKNVALYTMKQSFALVGTLVIFSVLLVVLMWAPFTYPMPAGQVVKYALIGAGLGLVFYLIAIRKSTRRRRSRTIGATPRATVGKAKKTGRAHSHKTETL